MGKKDMENLKNFIWTINTHLSWEATTIKHQQAVFPWNLDELTDPKSADILLPPDVHSQLSSSEVRKYLTWQRNFNMKLSRETTVIFDSLSKMMEKLIKTINFPFHFIWDRPKQTASVSAYIVIMDCKIFLPAYTHSMG